MKKYNVSGLSREHLEFLCERVAIEKAELVIAKSTEQRPHRVAQYVVMLTSLETLQHILDMALRKG